MSGAIFVDAAQIGLAAGQVWNFLNQHGPSSLNRMVGSLGLSKDVLLQALGWLAREDKLLFQKGNRGRLIRLK